MSTIKITSPSLTPRESVLDALYRALRSYDTYDIPLHDSAFYPSDSTTFVAAGQVYTGIEEIRSILHRAGPWDTTHIPSCERVEIMEGGKEAKLTATACHQHARKGEGVLPRGDKWFVGVLYDCDLKLDESDGLWKFTRFEMIIKWGDGNPAVLMD